MTLARAKQYLRRKLVAIYIYTVGAFFLQASEQYLIDSQFLAQDFLQVISFLQVAQILLGRKLLFPLNELLISTSIDHPNDSIDILRVSQSTSGRHRKFS